MGCTGCRSLTSAATVKGTGGRPGGKGQAGADGGCGPTWPGATSISGFQPKGRNEFVVVVIPTAAPAGEATLDPSKHLNNQAARTRHQSKRRYCITIMPHLDLS